MNYRKLGKAGFEVSEVGFGAWGIGGGMWVDTDDEESRAALNLAIDLGCNFIDTALVYGNGHSEKLVGEVVRSRSERIYVASKIPPKNMEWPARKGTPLSEVFPYDYIFECTEKSLENLGLDKVDLMQFHVWNDEWADQEEWQRAVSDLKAQGMIGAFGISINRGEPENAIKAARTGLIDAFQVVYNIFEQAPEDELFPVCQELNIGVIARVPLDEGGLTGKITPDTTFPEGDWRHSYFTPEVKRETWERVQKLQELLPEGMTLPEMALRFCLSHPAVSTVIPGMRRRKHVEANMSVGDGKGLPPDLVEKLKAHRWDRWR